MRQIRSLLSTAMRATADWSSFMRLLFVPLLLAELVLTALIILKIRFTHIDWRAYMEEVEGPLVHGVWDYAELRGETGPLVYPGGFVALYGALRLLAGGDGTEVRSAQWAFLGVYVGSLALVMACYAHARPRSTPPWCIALACASLRLHSIYVLRLFNDCWAMMLFWLACLLFCRARWRSGCLAYSLAVSVKANVLLSAPGLLVLLLQAHGPSGALAHIALCALVQLAVGLPFLRANPVGYVRAALGGFGDLKHKWTVNWKFVPPPLFHAAAFPLALLAFHLALLAFLAARRWTARHGGLSSLGSLGSLRSAMPRGRGNEGGGNKGSDGTGGGSGRLQVPLHAEHVLVTLLSSNALGVICARSLHFQFYCWYAHSVPLLLWRCETLPTALKLLCLGLLEYAWSYGLDRVEGTSTPASSLSLQLAHALLLYAIVRAEPPPLLAQGGQKGGSTAGVGKDE